MQLSHEIRVAVPPDEAFSFLQDLEAVAACMPGARTTGRDGDTYQGRLKLKVGPATVAYEGTVTVEELDATVRRARLVASGREASGQGSARATLVAAVAPDGEGSKVTVCTDLEVQGKAAQFGRGIVQDVSNRVVAQFAHNLEAALVRSGTGPTAEGQMAKGAAATASTPVPSSAAAPRARGEYVLDIWALMAVPLLKRLLPAFAAFAAGVCVGLLLRRRRTAHPPWAWATWPPPPHPGPVQPTAPHPVDMR